MERKFKITIPEPCHESWDKMTPNENGRFCMSCSKTVIDFSIMSSDEIQHFFIQNQNKKICGRFKNEQLESLIIQIPSQILYTQTNYHKIFLLALFIAMGTTLFSCADKDRNKKKIDKVEVVEDSSEHKGMATGGPMAVRKNDCDKNQPPLPSPPKKDAQKNPKIDYKSMATGEIQPVYIDNKEQEIIDYDMVFNTATIDVLPFPNGGISKFYSFFKSNLKSEQLTGKVYIYFIVEKDGTLSNFEIRNGAETEMGKEALRILKLAPKWTPGKLNNHAVRTSYSLPIIFK